MKHYIHATDHFAFARTGAGAGILRRLADDREVLLPIEEARELQAQWNFQRDNADSPLAADMLMNRAYCGAFDCAVIAAARDASRAAS